MATTAKGTPYVEASDLVAGYPAVSLDLAEHIDDNVAYNAATINAQTGTTYTFVLADATAGKLVTASNASASTYTVPPESSVVWPAGSVLRILNQGAGVVTVAAGSGVTINGTPLTLAQYKGAAIQKTGTDTWTFIPFSGGVGNAAISDTPTGSYTGYQYWTFTASGTLTVTTAGFADVLVVGGGGAGGSGYGGGGGAGGMLYATNVYLSAATHTVVVGGGGASVTKNRGYNGVTSRLGSFYGVGGGGGGGSYQGGSADSGSSPGTNGGSGGGRGAYSGNVGAGTSGQGNDGGGPQGGGGGANAVGSNGSGSNVGGNGGAGSANSITGSSVTYGGGGGGAGDGSAGSGGAGGGGGGSVSGTGTAGSVNTGGGGGAHGVLASTAVASGAGGSGIVIVRVAV